jgi:hypothetical protein
MGDATPVFKRELGASASSVSYQGRNVAPARGAVGKKKVTPVSKYFFGGCGEASAIFFIAFVNSPCYETPKSAIKQNRAK